MASVATKIGFIGSGQMARNLARGFIQSGGIKKENVIASDISEKQLLAAEELGVKVTRSNLEVIEQSDVVCLSVKPQHLKSVLDEVKPQLMNTKNTLLMSVAAGISTQQIEQLLPPHSRVIRVMPNTPASVSECASVYCNGVATTEKDSQIVKHLMSSIGICEHVSENLMDALTGISGCGPAYMFMVVEALADGGVRLGIPRDCAIRLAAQTMLGAAKMVLESGNHPAVLRDAVCSPGGATISAVSHLEQRNFRSSLIEAVNVAAERSKQLGANK